MINPFKTKKGLGRGLSSLIGDNDIKVSKNKISISSIVKNKFQPRKNFEKEPLAELTNSIKERGIIQPIIVRKSKTENDKFENKFIIKKTNEGTIKRIQAISDWLSVFNEINQGNHYRIKIVMGKKGCRAFLKYLAH